MRETLPVLADPSLSKAPLIGVCGPIGVGKSTIVMELASALGLRGRREDVKANPFFERSLADRATWGFWSQLAFMLGAVQGASIIRAEGGGVLERPVQEMFGVFVRDLDDAGLLDSREADALAQVVDASEKLLGRPDLFIVLHGDPADLMARLQARGNLGDHTYALSDMKRFAAAYDTWRASLEGEVIDVNIREVDLRSADAISNLAKTVEAILGRA